MVKKLIKGNYAIAQAALKAGCEAYFGYPVTPQSEIGEYLSGEMQKLNLAYICAESEIAAINMLLGACSTGAKAMTSSSSMAIALMQESIGYIAADELPAVIISVMRAGPALGYIYPAQGDYNQAVVGGSNGDYRTIVLAPSTVQECVDLTYKSFYLAHKWRNPVILLADGLLGQMMEPVEIGENPYPEISSENWALSGAKNRNSRAIYSLEPKEEVLNKRIINLFEKYYKIEKEETEFEEYLTEDADFIVSCFGSLARNVKSAIDICRKDGLKVGMLRPITLYPFPSEKISQLSKKSKEILVVEMNMGQMLKDIKIAVNGQCDVSFYGKPVGEWLRVEDIAEEIKTKYTQKEKTLCK